MLLDDRYMRQEMLERYNGKLKQLQDTRVAVLGAGGVGGLGSLLLALAGVGHIHLADGDTVASHNLHRQILFNEADIGKSKAQCAKDVLLAHNSSLDLKIFDTFIDESNFDEFTKDCSLILDVTDNAQSRLKISKLALDKGIDLISGAVSGYTALISIFAYKDKDFVEKYGCYRCLTGGDSINTKVGITGPTAESCATLTAHVTLEYILGNKSLVGNVLRLDMLNFNMHKIKLCRDTKCHDCHGL